MPASPSVGEEKLAISPVGQERCYVAKTDSVSNNSALKDTDCQ